MFIAFFFLLRKRGINVSLSEWMSLLEGLEKGLHQSGLSGFYYLCRAVVVHDESDFDKFDQAFLEFFKDAEFTGELPDEFREWLEHPVTDMEEVVKDLSLLDVPPQTMEEILDMIEDRLRTQHEEHDGGHKWIGTRGYTPMGNSGWSPHGVRIGGGSMYRTARSVAGDRKFRDFRKDNTLDTRSFQQAFRTLRSLSAQTDTSERELDLDGTVQDTADNAGYLKIRMRPPRKNTIKVLMFMDSGGSMDFYARLSSMLFQAAVKSGNFKELHTYYFHNCIYDEVYEEPTLRPDGRVPMEYIMHNYGQEYRVILVGDAMMDPYELHGKNYDWRTRSFSENTGIDEFRLILKKYPHCVWLNPEPAPVRNGYWNQTHIELKGIFPMFHLSRDGIEQAMKVLMRKN